MRSDASPRVDVFVVPGLGDSVFYSAVIFYTDGMSSLVFQHGLHILFIFFARLMIQLSSFGERMFQA